MVQIPVAEFDAIVDEYEALHAEAVKASGYPTTHFDEYKVREVGRRLAAAALGDRPLRFLNFGCGIGKSEPFIREYLPAAHIYSIDVSSKSVDAARERNAGLENVHFAPFDGHRMPFEEQFDVVFVANVFHHIPRTEHARAIQLIRNSLAPGGRLFLFEHNPINPMTVRTVNACPFDEGVVLLHPDYTRALLAANGFRSTEICFTLFFPKPLAFLSPIEPYLGWLPLGAQYYALARNE